MKIIELVGSFALFIIVKWMTVTSLLILLDKLDEKIIRACNKPVNTKTIMRSNMSTI